MKPTKVRRRLQESLQDRRIATAVRDDRETWAIDGFVIAMAKDWVVLHALDDGVHLDRIVMLRMEDISRVWFRDDDAYHHRAIAGLGQGVASFDCDPDVTAAELIDGAAGRADIFALHFELLDGEPLFIGRLIKRRKKSIDLHFVGRDGVWADEPERWKYRDVTRIEMGGRYLTALNRFADPYPSPEGQDELDASCT